jgi:hypothetical protein
MRLIVHSDASYLSETRARSRGAGIQYLTSNEDDGSLPPNGATDILSAILPGVVGAVSEAEYGTLFMNGQSAAATRGTLEDLGHPQPPTLIIADNTTAVGIANGTQRVKRSKAIDMRFHWIRDRVQKNEFIVTWKPGSQNLADYFSKIHPTKRYQESRNLYCTDYQGKSSERVC